MFNQDVYLCHVYIPPTSSKVLKGRNIDLHEEKEKGIEQYSLLDNTFITGDLNSRTANLIDYTEIDP